MKHDFFILLRKGGDVLSGTLGQGVPNSKAEAYRIKAQLRTLAILTIKFSAHNDDSLEYPVSKALGGRLMIAVVVVLLSSRED